MVEVLDGVDAGLLWHSGNPVADARALDAEPAWVRLANREPFRISGPDRLDWLHSLTSQKLSDLAPGEGFSTLVLSPQGRIEQAFSGMDDGETMFGWSEPGHRQPLLDWLESMKFMMRVDLQPITDHVVYWVNDQMEVSAAVWRPCEFGGREVLLPAGEVPAGREVGTWALEAKRIEAGVPRIFLDTDDKTIPNEIGLYGTHLEKGCYRGQETVARVHTLGRPPRRLTMLHLDGSMDALPEVGADLLLAGKKVGFVGSSARHHELGPIALALIKRNVDTAATLVVNDIAASQTVLVDPDVGIHFRPQL